MQVTDLKAILLGRGASSITSFFACGLLASQPLSKISAHGHGIQVPRYAYTNLFAAILPYADTMMKLLFENFSKSCPLFKIAYI